MTHFRMFCIISDFVIDTNSPDDKIPVYISSIVVNLDLKLENFRDFFIELDLLKENMWLLSSLSNKAKIKWHLTSISKGLDELNSKDFIILITEDYRNLKWVILLLMNFVCYTINLERIVYKSNYCKNCSNFSCINLILSNKQSFLKAKTFETGLSDLHKMHWVKSDQMRIYFWSVFSCIRTEYRDLLRKSPYSVRIQENTGQK